MLKAAGRIWRRITSRVREAAFLLIPTPAFLIVVFSTRSLELALAVSYLAGLTLLRIRNFTEVLHVSAIEKKFAAQKKKPFLCTSDQIEVVASSPLTIRAVSEPLAQVKEHYVTMQLKVYSDDAEKFINGLSERIKNNTFFAVVAVLFLCVKVAPQIQAAAMASANQSRFDLNTLIPSDSNTLIVTLAAMALQILNLLKPLWVYRERNKGAV
jgi:hypothetical protein